MLARTWRFPAIPECVSSTRREVGDFAGEHAVPEPPLENLKLALSEAVTNAVVHAYRASAPGTVTVRVEIEAAAVTVCVTDDGEGMSPRVDSPGLGLGMPLMGTLADVLEIEDAGERPGTTVRMRFAITG